MVTSLDKLKDSLKPKYDVFIASASFESRCIKIAEKITPLINFKYKYVSIISPPIVEVENTIESFVNLGFEKIYVNNIDQISTFSNFITPISNTINNNPKSSFLIDITTFTRQTLLILLRILRNTLTKDNLVQFLYTPAAEYAVGLKEEEKWLTKGILEVNSVIGYSGIIRPSRPYHLIILMGYEVERASSLINEYEPTKITIGYSKKGTSTSANHYPLNKKRFEELLSEFPNAESFEFSCNDVLECKKNILKQVKKHKGYNVVISPMNNKISSLATALAAFDNEEIQIAIAVPAVYNINYSSPRDCCHIIDIPDFIKK